MFESLLYILTNFPLLLKGVIIAIEITVCSIGLGMVLGIFVAFLKIYGSKPMKKVVSVYEGFQGNSAIGSVVYCLFRFADNRVELRSFFVCGNWFGIMFLSLPGTDLPRCDSFYRD